MAGVTLGALTGAVSVTLALVSCDPADQPLPTPTPVVVTPASTPLAGAYQLDPYLTNLSGFPSTIRAWDDGLLVGMLDGQIYAYTGSDGGLIGDLRGKVSTVDQNGLLSIEPVGAGVYAYYTATDCGRCGRVVFMPWQEQVLGEPTTVTEIPLDPTYRWHNGGDLRYYDGALWLGLGDGTDGGDSNNAGQDPDAPGSILRIDPDSGEPTIWATGFRNPWRMSWDRGDLWVGDVGEEHWEEINVVTKGGNYGWSVWEGNECFKDNPACDTTPYLPPVITYGRDDGGTVCGGMVYRGDRLPELAGWYVYGDFASGNLWAYRDGVVTRLMTGAAGCTGFAEGDGYLYIADGWKRAVWRLAPKAAPP